MVRPILERGIPRGKSQVSLSAFAYLFSELVQEAERGARSDYEAFVGRLKQTGAHVGVRVLELLAHREAGNKRETSRVGMLNFITKTVWKSLFGKAADQLLQNAEGYYLIVEAEPITNRFVSPRKNSAVNVALFIGGIIEGVLCGAAMEAAVKVLFDKNDMTVFMVQFIDSAG